MSGVTNPPTPIGDGTYVGEIRCFASDFSPAEGWLECNGRSLVIANHPKLFNVVANAFGGSDPGTFRIPDFRGAFLRGRNHGKPTSEEGPIDPDAARRTVPQGGPHYTDDNDHVGTFQLDQIQVHKHEDSGHQHLIPHFTYGQDSGGGGFGNLENKEPGTWTNAAQANLGPPTSFGAPVRQGSETRATNVSVLFCIRDPDWSKP